MQRCFFLFLAVFALAQAATEVEITAEPHHHLTFTNDQVRVFNLEVPPHGETLLHRHRHDKVDVILGASEVLNAVVGKEPVTVKVADGEADFIPGNFAHISRNLSDRPFRAVTIELLQDDKLRQAQAKRQAAHAAAQEKETAQAKREVAHVNDDVRGLNILQGGTQEILWVHDGVRASLIELQLGGVLPPVLHSHLLIAVSDVALMPSQQVHGGIPSYVPRDAQLKSGDSKWLAGNSPSLTNVGQKTARFVTLEFP